MSNEAEKKSLCPECHRMAAVGTSRGHAIDCKFEGRATNEAEAPPERLWLPLEAALLLRGDEHGPHEIEYVPASALAEVWDETIRIVREQWNAWAKESYDIREKSRAASIRLADKSKAADAIAIKLEAARDAALSAGKEGKDGIHNVK